MQRERPRVDSVTEDLALIGYFRDQLAALSESKVRDLLALAASTNISNKDARSVLKVGRVGTWYWLDKLTKLTMLEKRGQYYRASRYTSELVHALSLTFRSVLNGKLPNVEDSEAFSKVISLAFQGLESLYDTGKIDPEEYKRTKNMLKDLEKARGGAAD